MRISTGELVASVQTTATNEAVFDALADLTAISAWWIWSSPSPRVQPPVVDVRQVNLGGLRASQGVAVEIIESGETVRFLGRRLKQPTKKHRFTCELVHRPHRLRLSVVLDTSDIGGWSAFDFEIVPTPTGCQVTLRLESEVVGTGPRATLVRAITGNAVKVAEGTLAKAVALTGDTSHMDSDRAAEWARREPPLVDGSATPTN